VKQIEDKKSVFETFDAIHCQFGWHHPIKLINLSIWIFAPMPKDP